MKVLQSESDFIFASDGVKESLDKLQELIKRNEKFIITNVQIKGKGKHYGEGW